MFGVTTLGLVMLAPAAVPPPAPPPVPNAGPADRNQAVTFANMVYQLGTRIQGDYARPVTMNNLIQGAVRGLHEEAGAPLPDEVVASVRRARENSSQLVDALVEARLRLGNHPALAGSRSLFAAIGGFRHATDPVGGLVTQRVNNYASVDMDFGVGIELEGATGTQWTIYQFEYGIAMRWFAPIGWFGPVPTPDAVVPPVTLPWRIKRVIPGSPAQKAGVRPGDRITHLNGIEITPTNASRLFAEFAIPPGSHGPGLPIPNGLKWRLALSRTGAKAPITVELETRTYPPESVFGVMRREDGTWDGMLDRENRIGYVRLGPIEDTTDTRMDEIVTDLVSRRCRGLIMDLRWCPGGYVTPATRMLSLFLPHDTLIAQIVYGHPDQALTSPMLRTAGTPRFPDLPILVLVGSETVGGGELIAAALQDNPLSAPTKRAAVMGQRTVGRAYIQNPRIDAGFGNLVYKLSTGTSLRPNGKPRQRTEKSQPHDDWGVRPDPGLEVPVTADLSAELREAAELHGLRPADSDEILSFDDPTKDPFRMAALAYFRKKFTRK
jgi:C-terminal processing protease CtpA/Prc